MPLVFSGDSNFRLQNGDLPTLAPTFNPQANYESPSAGQSHAPSLGSSQPRTPQASQSRSTPVVSSQSDASPRIEAPPLSTHPSNLNVNSPARSGSGRTPTTTPTTATPPTSGPSLHDAKSFLGPEFVSLASKPPKQIFMPHLQHLKSGTQLRPARITLLNGQSLDLPCDMTTSAKQMFDAVVKHLGLSEHYYFGITHINSGEHMFIDLSTKFSKLAGSSWKDPKAGLSDRPYMLYFRVKFYVDDVEHLKNPLTKHLFYLQLRRDILEERVHCCEEDVLNLASMALQAECGDYHSALGRNYFYVEHYLPQRIMRRVGSSYIKDKLPKMHEARKGEYQTETLFLREAQQLNEYGIHFYRILKNKQERNVPMWVGMNTSGLSITEKHQESRFHLFRWPWSQLQNLSFNRRRFSVLPKSDTKDAKSLKLTFYTESYKQGRYLLQFSTQQHNFQLKIQRRLNIADVVDEGWSDKPSRNKPVAQTNGDHVNQAFSHDTLEKTKDKPPADVKVPPKEDKVKRMKWDRIEVGYPIRTIPTPQPAPAPVSTSSLIESKPSYKSSFDDYPSSPERSPGPVDGDYELDIHNDYLEPNNNPPDYHLIEPSIVSRDRSYPEMIELTAVLDPPPDGFNSLPVSEHSSFMERRIILVKLEKDPMYGVGITIVGGENASHLDLGIFIKSITTGGPAEMSALVHAGDRIIGINGRSLEGISHLKAVDLIRESDTPVHFLLSQPALPIPSLDDMRSKIPGPGSSRTSLGSRDTTPQVSRGSSRMEDSVDLNGSTLVARFDNDSLSDTGTLLHNEGTSYRRVARLPAGATYDVVLRKVNASLGLNVGGGVNTESVQGGVYIESMAAGGPAHVDGRILVGDRLLEVNGVPLSGATHKQAVNTLRHAPDVCRLSMEKSARRVDPDYSFITQENSFTVSLEKENNSLGFSIIGGRDDHVTANNTENIARINQVFPRGPAFFNGRMEVGDVLLAVNDQPCRHLEHPEIISQLRGSPAHVKLKLCRTAPGVLPSLSNQQAVSPHHVTSSNHAPTEALIHENNAQTAENSPDLWRNPSWKQKRPEFSRTNRLPSETDPNGHSSSPDRRVEPPSQLVRPMELLTVSPSRKDGATSPASSILSDRSMTSSMGDVSTLTPQVIEVGLRKARHKGGLGFTIENNPREPGCYIQSILCDPALSEARLNPGDKIISVNDVDVSNYDKDQLVDTLDILPDDVELRIIHDPRVCPRRLPDDQAVELIHVNLEKPPDGTLGIAISGVERGTAKRGIYIKTVTTGSVADLDGRIKEGDRLVQVGEESVMHVKVKQAVVLLKRASGVVSLVVSRNMKPVGNANGDLPQGSPLNETVLSRAHQPSQYTAPHSMDAPQLPTENNTRSPSRVSDAGETSSTGVGPDEHEALQYLIDSVKPFYDHKPTTNGQELINYGNQYSNHSNQDVLEIEEPAVVDIIDRRSEIPDPITEHWIGSLKIVEPVKSDQYSRDMLPTMIHGLQEFIENEEPEKEFKELRSMEPSDTCDAAKLPENKSLNRYRNVLPYDTCRVRLVHTESDYTNGSHIFYRVGKRQHSYIACQGPLPHTTEDFWLMVWQQCVSVVAMTTLETESGKNKCHRYWPESVDESIQVYEKYRVGLTSEESLLNFDVRKVWMEDLETGVRREIYQLHYSSWPDHATPESAIPLMHYIKLLHMYHTTGPILAHCSAGIGRTGVFITVDVALSHIDHGHVFDILKIVKSLRRQRPGMIQTKDQYVFCYQACLEALYTLADDHGLKFEES